MSEIAKFPSFKCDVGIKNPGKYYYEFQVARVESQSNCTSNFVQIEWCDDQCSILDSNIRGIGDGAHSWTFNGERARKWQEHSYVYGKLWKLGDIIGCSVDIHSDGNSFDIGYYINGEYLGLAFKDCKYSGSLYPALSLHHIAELYLCKSYAV